MMVLQDGVSGGQALPGRLKQVIYSLTHRCPPTPVPHWLNTVGCTVFSEVTCLIISLWGILFSSFPTYIAVFKEDFLASLSLHPTSCLLGTLQVREFCLLCK